MKLIIAYKNYYKDFYESLSQEEKDKVDRVMVLMQSENRMPSHYIKHLDEGQLVILFNCFVKKTQKTPRSEIQKAIELKREYYEEKRNK